MMATLSLPENLHLLNPGKIVHHLQSLLQTTPHSEITPHLLGALQSGAHPPSIFKLWLSISPAHSTILVALSQTTSTSVRRAAIKVLWKRLRTKDIIKWTNVWDSIGGASGLLKIFREASIGEIRLLCGVFAWNTNLTDPPEKREKYTEFFKCLLSERFPDAEHKNPDERRLYKLYAKIQSVCNAPFIESQAAARDPWPPEYKWRQIRDNLAWTVHGGYLEYSRLCADLKDFPGAEEWINLYLELFPGSLETTIEEASPSLRLSQKLLEELEKKSWKSKLRKANKTNYAKNPISFPDGVIYPLVRRVCKGHPPPELTKRILDLSLAFFTDRKKVIKSIQSDPYDLLNLTIIAWSTSPETFSSYFNTFLNLYYTKSHLGIENISLLLGRVPISLRYQLLRILLKESKDLDIDNDQDLKKSKLKFGFDFLALFPPDEAFKLFNRVKEANEGALNFIKENDIGSVLSLKFETVSIDPDIWQIYLLYHTNQNKSAEELASKCYTSKKSKAVIEPTPQARAARVREAMYYTVASGSPNLYRECMEWIRQRFIRDSFVVSYIYEHYTKEAEAIFVGVPENLEGLTVTDVTSRIKESNKLLETLYTTAFAAAREPAFNIRVWNRSLGLIPFTIEQRMKAEDRVKMALELTDDGIYEMLWEGLVDLIVIIEEKGLQPGYEALKLNTVRGILCYQQRNPELNGSSVSTYRFFDALARARDELWQRVRKEFTSNSLPEIFPRGLPIQSLITGFKISDPRLEEKMPYIYSRAREAVILSSDSTKTVPSDEETWESIGQFIDDYGWALRLLVPESLSRPEKKERLTTVLTHAIDYLGGELKPLERGTFWKYWLSTHAAQSNWRQEPWRRIIEDISNEFNLDNWPTLKSLTAQMSEINEWDPQGNSVAQSRELELTYLSLSLQIAIIYATEGTIDTKLNRFKPRTPAQADIFSRERMERAVSNPEIREGQILAAIGYVTQYFSITNEVMSPIPGRYDVIPRLKARAQPMTLHVLTPAIDTLNTHIEYIPPALLEQLVAGMIDKLTTENIPTAVKLIKLLAESDNPYLAAQYAISTVLKYPDSSSWHRQLLQPGYLKWLTQAKAREFSVKFAEGIISTLEASTKTATEGQAAQQPYIKITTMKQLSTLLTYPGITPSTAIDILTELSQHATHVDVRSSILDSLIRILMECTDDALAEKTVAQMEFAIPIAGDLNTRAPIPETKWAEAEEKSDVGLLEVQIDYFMANPLLQIILSTAGAGFPRDNFRWKDLFVERVVVKVLQELKKHTERYIKIFLRGCGLEVDVVEKLVPEMKIVPGSWVVWQRLAVSEAAWLPRQILEDYAEYQVYRISLPEEFVKLEEKLEGKEWKNSPGVSFWKTEYGNELASGMPKKLNTLRNTKRLLEKQGMEGEAVKDEMVKFLVSSLFCGFHD